MSKLKITLQAIVAAAVLPVLVYTNTLNPAKVIEQFKNADEKAASVSCSRTTDNSAKSSYAVYPEIVYPHFITQ